MGKLELVKTVSDLPDWFKLENYDALSMDILPDQLISRAHLLNGFEEEEWPCHEWDLNDSAMYLDIKNQGVIKKRSVDELVQFVTGKKSLIEYYAEDGLTEQQLGIVVEGWADIWDRAEKSRHPESTRLVSCDSVEPLNIGYVDALKHRIDKAAYFHRETPVDLLDGDNWGAVIIDVRRPNEEIISDLELYINQYRELKKIDVSNPTPKNGEFEKAYLYRVCPIIDLMFWARISKARIPNRVFAAAIFPNGEYGEEDIRKTIKPFIGKLMDFDYLSVLNKRYKNRNKV